MGKIRLFKSGTHKGLNFSNEEVSEIAESTISGVIDKLPIVLGHPKNDLPVIGYLPRSAIEVYEENGDVAVGFDREQAELSEQSMEVLRQVGHNKISVRLKGGQITHIGLVKKAAVNENNNQDFSEDEAVYYTDADFQEQKSNIIDKLKRTFKMVKEEEKEQTTSQDFNALNSKVDGIVGAVEKIVTVLNAQASEREKSKISADFSANDFSHLTDEQKQQAIDFAATMSSTGDVETFKQILQAGNVKPPVVQGSVAVAADFSAEKRELKDIISEQIK